MNLIISIARLFQRCILREVVRVLCDFPTEQCLPVFLELVIVNERYTDIVGSGIFNYFTSFLFLLTGADDVLP